MKSVFLLTGYGKEHLDEIKNNKEFLISENIYDASLLIRNQTDKF
jgi:hypothetical protein